MRGPYDADIDGTKPIVKAAIPVPTYITVYDEDLIRRPTRSAHAPHKTAGNRRAIAARAVIGIAFIYVAFKVAGLTSDTSLYGPMLLPAIALFILGVVVIVCGSPRQALKDLEGWFLRERQS